MPQIKTFTAPLAGAATVGGRRATAADFGGQEAAALQGLAGVTRQIGEQIQLDRENHDKREFRLAMLRQQKAFNEDMQVALEEGGDFDEVRQKHTDELSTVAENLQTSAGSLAAREALAEMDLSFDAAARTARAQRVKIEVANQVTEFRQEMTELAASNPDDLPDLLNQTEEFIDSFTRVGPEERQAVRNSELNAVAFSAGKGLLLQDPHRLLDILTEGEGIPHITGAQKTQLISQARSEIKRLESEKTNFSEYHKMLVDQALKQASETRALDEGEAETWFALGVSGLKYSTAMTRSREFEAERVEVAGNAKGIRAGLGGSLSEEKYQKAIDHIIDGVVAQTEDPKQKFADALDARIILAARNGHKDNKLASALNAGAFGQEEAFAGGQAIRHKLAELQPDLLHQMLNKDARMNYNNYDFLTSEMGLDDQAARESMFEARENRGEIEKRLKSEDAKDAVEDALDDLTSLGFFSSTETDTVTQVPMFRRQVTERAIAYMALSPTMPAEYAVKTAAKDVTDATIEMGGFRVPIKGVPPNWNKAENYVRRVVVKRDFEAADMPIPDDIRILDRLVILPTGNGRANIINPDNGLTIAVDYDLGSGVAEWWQARGLPEFERRQLLAAEISEARQAGRTEEEARRAAELVRRQGGPAIGPRF